MRLLIYTLALVVLGLRAVERNAALASPWYELAQVALVIGTWSMVIAWFLVERHSAEPTKEVRHRLTRPRTNRTHDQRFRIGVLFRRKVQHIGNRWKQTGLHPSWVLLSALLALMTGLFLERAALAANDRGLERTAVLLAIYGIAVTWVYLSPAVLRRWKRTRRALHSWQSARTRKK